MMYLLNLLFDLKVKVKFNVFYYKNNYYRIIRLTLRVDQKKKIASMYYNT